MNYQTGIRVCQVRNCHYERGEGKGADVGSIGVSELPFQRARRIAGELDDRAVRRSYVHGSARNDCEQFNVGGCDVIIDARYIHEGGRWHMTSGNICLLHENESGISGALNALKLATTVEEKASLESRKTGIEVFAV